MLEQLKGLDGRLNLVTRPGFICRFNRLLLQELELVELLQKRAISVLFTSPTHDGDSTIAHHGMYARDSVPRNLILAEFAN